MYKIRFNLGRGINYKKWKITDSNKNVIIYDPKLVSLELINTKLCNRRTTAQKIFEGKNKSVCAWIECEDIKICTNGFYYSNEVSYNPKLAPYWVMNQTDVDEYEFDRLITVGNKIYYGHI